MNKIRALIALLLVHPVLRTLRGNAYRQALPDITEWLGVFFYNIYSLSATR